MTFLEAIAREEGFYVEGSRPQRNNNPGDLEYHPWMGMYGSKGGDPRFAIFPTPEQGFAALKALFGFSEYASLNVADALAKFAPGNENDTASYLRNVCAFCECQPTDLIADLLNGQAPAPAI